MAGLILKLAPNERVLLNGMVVENGPRKAQLTIQSNHAHVLRLRDALHPEALRGPVSRAYHLAQMAVAGEQDEPEALKMLAAMLAELTHVFAPTEHSARVEEAKAECAAGHVYKTMRALAPLLPLERELLGIPEEDTASAPSKESVQ